MFKNVQHVKDIILDESKKLTWPVVTFVRNLKQQRQPGVGASGPIWDRTPRKLCFPTLIYLKPLWEPLITGQILGLRVFEELQFILSDRTITLITLSAQRITFKMKQK